MRRRGVESSARSRCYTFGTDTLMAEVATSIDIPRRALFKAAEVCELMQVQPYVLRSWETEFPNLGVSKSGGARVYRRSDVEQVARSSTSCSWTASPGRAAADRGEGAPVGSDGSSIDELIGQNALGSSPRSGAVAIDPRPARASVNVRSGCVSARRPGADQPPAGQSAAGQLIERAEGVRPLGCRVASQARVTGASRDRVQGKGRLFVLDVAQPGAHLTGGQGPWVESRHPDQ